MAKDNINLKKQRGISMKKDINKHKELGTILDRLHKSNLDSDLIQDTGIKVLKDMESKDIANLYGYVRQTYRFLALDNHKKQTKEKEIMQSNIRYVDGIEVDISESVPAPPIKDTEKKLKLINAIIQNEIHSNKLLKVFDLKFNQLKSQKDMVSSLGINRTTLAMQEKRLIELLQGIDNLRDILASPVFPINNIPTKGSAPSIKTLTRRLSGAVNILVRHERREAMIDRKKRQEPKIYEHAGPIPAPYKELTQAEIEQKNRSSKRVLYYQEIKAVTLTAKEKALELVKQGIDKMDIKSVPYKLWDLQDRVLQACPEELNLMDREYTAWGGRHPFA